VAPYFPPGQFRARIAPTPFIRTTLGVDYIERRGQTVATSSPKPVNVDIAPFHRGASWRQNAQTGSA
jgi:hypothetical protein